MAFTPYVVPVALAGGVLAALLRRGRLRQSRASVIVLASLLARARSATG